RIRLHPKAAAYEEAVSVHRGVLPVAARDLGCRALRAEQPLQHAVDSADDSAISFGETELDEAQQPPVRPLPLLIRMAGVIPKQRRQPGVHSYRLHHGHRPQEEDATRALRRVACAASAGGTTRRSP